MLGDELNLNSYLKRITTFFLVACMLLTTPLEVFASNTDLILLSTRRDPVNTLNVSPYKLTDVEDETEVLKDKKQPDIYTFRMNFKAQRGEKYKKSHQPYVVSVGADTSDKDKARINKEIKLPDIKGYIKPQNEFSINYDVIKSRAEKELAKTKDGVINYQAEQDFKYRAKKVGVKVKHVFQMLKDFNKYGNKPGESEPIVDTQFGSTGSTMEIKPLDEKYIKGFEPEAEFILTQVPEDTKDFELEYRYNRAYYDVVFDCDEGTPIPARTLYYEQIIPKIEDTDMTTKSGMIFKGWKPSVDLKGSLSGVDTVFKKDEIMKDASGNPSYNLDLNLQMPAEKVTFTAVWESKKEADYTVLFWAEKADYPKDAKLLNKYDFVGAHVYKNQPVGKRPELEKEPVKGVKFTDLDAARLQRIYNEEKVKVNNPNGNEKMDLLYLNKFYVYNKDLTNKQNVDSKHQELIKKVSPTGKTVYNIYYDRQVYKLWFTKGSFEASFYPTLTRNGEVLGKPGAPYHFEARFNQSLVGMWPNDILEVGGFKEDNNSLGWSILQGVEERLYRDTPPYRLTANEFVDYPELSTKGLAKEIPMGEGVAPKKAGPFDIAFGIDQSDQVFPIHEDFLLDGFEEGEQSYDYDLYMVKSDTNNSDYDFTPPDLQGFTGKGKKRVEKFDAFDLQDDKNEARDEETPFPKVYYRYKGKRRQKGKIYFMWSFPRIDPLNEEEKEDLKKPIEDLEEDENENEDSGDEYRIFDQNGYIAFEYSRNKYELKLNNDPDKEKDDSDYKAKDKIQVFYDYPLNKLNLDKDHKPEKPEGIPDNWEFKGWAMDIKGQKLVRKINETMPARDLILYAQWGEPDYKWKVIFDANGGTLPDINTENLTVEKKTIVEGDTGQEKKVTYPLGGEKTKDKQVFTVVQHQKLNLPAKPNRKGYEFRGWELIRYKRDKDGNYTNNLDKEYSKKYRDISGARELYSFGNDVVSPLYLKAIWIPTDTVDIKVEHYLLNKDFNVDKFIFDEIENKRVNYLVAATGDQQNEEWILADDEELTAHPQSNIYDKYRQYNDRVKFNNTYFQTFRVEPAKILDQETGLSIDNPKYKDNVFKFFYRRYRTRNYKVNYVDVRAKEAIEATTDLAEKTRLIRANSIIGQEKVISKCRDFDVRNYRPIPGWVLADGEKPQQQLFYDVNERTNELLGINGSGSDEITFYYQDVRAIELKDPNKPVPIGYVRVTFKATDGGSFKDSTGKEVKEINYDVIKGLKFELLPVPKLAKKGEAKLANKYYISPDAGREFIAWKDRPLLDKNTLIQENQTFTACFDWNEIKINPLVTTEAFTDPNGRWTNDFAPTVDKLKGQVKWFKNKVESDLPAGVDVKFADDIERTIADSFKEMGKKDHEELVRDIKIPAKIKYADNSEQDIEIPVKVYKNRYEALNENADKPKFLSDAEKLEAKDGGLKDVTGDYIKVRVKPNKDFDARDSKVYYVNKNAWVEIPKIDTAGDSRFTNWTADKKAQNEEEKENGIFDFTKRHKFTEETLITPRSAQDVVEQDSKNKPDVPESYVKVIIDKTEKAALAAGEKQRQTFWVNPTKEVTITVSNPKGKKVEADPTKQGTVGYTMNFSKWQTEDKSKTWEDKIEGKFENETTIIAKYSVTPEIIKAQVPTLKAIDLPQGKIPTAEEIKDKITAPEGKAIKEVKIVNNPDVTKPGDSKVTVIVEYTDGSSVGTNDHPIKIPVKVHEPIVTADPLGNKPDGTMDNYVKVIFKEGAGGTLGGQLVYYVSPEVEIDLEAIAASIKKTPNTGYFVNGENWTNANGKTLKGQFAQEAVFEFEFEKSNDIITKTDDSVKKPEGYVTVTFRTDGNGQVDGKDEIVYFVNPNAGIKIGKTKTQDNKTIVIPKVTANETFSFNNIWQEPIDETKEIKNDRTHVAIMQKGQVTLTYDKGGADVTGNPPANVTTDTGKIVGLAEKGNLAKENFTFAGWKIENNIYQAGYQLELTKNLTAIAQWTSTKHTVTFISMGGSNVQSQEVSHGQKLQAFDEPKLEGKVFVGWKEKGKENEAAYFNLDTSIEENKTLIATWQDPVKEIKENDQVEPQFIKVSFKQEANGSLNKEEVTYKVAKDLSFEDAKQAGMKVPEIKAAKYYKAIGWDKELKLEGQDIVFNAKYEAEDIIPIDPNIPDDQIKANRPDGMIIVTFKVAEADTDKAFIKAIRKFYVKKDKEVTIDPPTVYNKTMDYTFKGWEGKTLQNNKLVITFTEDTEIKALGASLPQMEIQLPRAGYKTVYVLSNLNGASGKLAVKINGTWKEYTAETKTVRSRRGRRIISQDFTTFTLEKQLIAGDQIRYWAEKDGVKSEVREYTVKSFN